MQHQLERNNIKRASELGQRCVLFIVLPPSVSLDPLLLFSHYSCMAAYCRYSYVPHFAVSLELLLHQTLEQHIRLHGEPSPPPTPIESPDFAKKDRIPHLPTLTGIPQTTSEESLLPSYTLTSDAPTVPPEYSTDPLRCTMNLLQRFSVHFATAVAQFARKTGRVR